MADKNSQDERKWKIRDAEGNFFGPATMETLKKWARDGRLSAEQSVSCDGEFWQPVDVFPELGMNWAAELAPGKFFGPVHQDAMKEFIRTGDVPADAAQFVRVASIDETPETLRAENEGLREKLRALREDFGSRASKLEAELASAEAKARIAAGDLATRDLEFDAERQSFAAEKSRMDAERKAIDAEKTKLRAELAKAEKRAEVLAAQVAESEARNRSREADVARIAELESQAKEAAKEMKLLRAELDNQAADARRKLKEAEVAALAEKKELEAGLREARAAASGVAALKKREDGVRRLLAQIETLLGQDRGEIVEADAVIIESADKA